MTKNEIVIDQAILAWASTDDFKGYQVIASSKGLKSEEEDIVKKTTQPGNIPSNFEYTSSHNLFQLPSGRICFAKLKNIGTGLDGRPNSTCAHCFIFPHELLPKIDWELRLFEEHFNPDNSKRGELSQMDDGTIISSNKNLDGKRNGFVPSDRKSLTDLISAIFALKLGNYDQLTIRAEIEKDPFYPLKDFLNFLPPSDRFTSIFSTYLFNNHRSKAPFEIFIVPPESSYSSPSDEKVGHIDLIKETRDFRKPKAQHKNLAQKVADILKSGDKKELEKIYEDNRIKVDVENLPIIYNIHEYEERLESGISIEEKISIHQEMAKEWENIRADLAEENYEKAFEFSWESDKFDLESFEKLYKFFISNKNYEKAKKVVEKTIDTLLNDYMVYEDHYKEINDIVKFKTNRRINDIYENTVLKEVGEVIREDPTIISDKESGRFYQKFFVDWLDKTLESEKPRIGLLQEIRKNIDATVINKRHQWVSDLIELVLPTINKFDKDRQKMDLLEFCYDLGMEIKDKKSFLKFGEELFSKSAKHKKGDYARETALILMKKKPGDYKNYFSRIKYLCGVRDAYRFYYKLSNLRVEKEVLSNINEEISEDIRLWNKYGKSRMNHDYTEELEKIERWHRYFKKELNDDSLKEKIINWF